jgi:hypothetical protein
VRGLITDTVDEVTSEIDWSRWLTILHRQLALRVHVGAVGGVGVNRVNADDLFNTPRLRRA